MVCKNCGRQVVPTDRFCPDCGTPVVVEEPVVETPVVETPVAAKTTRTRKTPAKTEEPKTEEKKVVTSSSLLQAISAARNNSKLASDDEVAPQVEEKVEESAVETVVEEPVVETPVAVEEPVETPIAVTATVEVKEQPKIETPVSNEPFIPTVTSTKKPKGFGVASIVISSIMMIALAFVIVFAVLLLTAKDGGTVIGLILIGGAFALIGLSPFGVVSLGVPTILSLVFAIIQTVKAKRKLSWIALIFAILAVVMLAVVAALTFAVDWNSAFQNMSM